jgi:hypothetical protein
MRAFFPRTLRGVLAGSIVSLAAGCGAATTTAPPPTQDPIGSPTSDRIDTASWPTARRIAERTIVLCAVAARGFLDAESPADAEEMQSDLIEFIERNELVDELEPTEAALLAAPIGSLDRQSMIDSTWRLEGMSVLAWTLGVADIPPHDHAVEGIRTCVSLGLLSRETPLLLTLPQRRPPEQIARMESRLFGIHWRLVDYRAQSRRLDFRAVAASNWSGVWDLSNVPLVDDDLAIRGVRVDLAEPSARSEAESIARERHQAINWVMGRSSSYSMAPDET